jgi:hypothetical protein
MTDVAQHIRHAVPINLVRISTFGEAETIRYSINYSSHIYTEIPLLYCPERGTMEPGNGACEEDCSSGCDRIGPRSRGGLNRALVARCRG